MRLLLYVILGMVIQLSSVILAPMLSYGDYYASYATMYALLSAYSLCISGKGLGRDSRELILLLSICALVVSYINAYIGMNPEHYEALYPYIWGGVVCLGNIYKLVEVAALSCLLYLRFFKPA